MTNAAIVGLIIYMFSRDPGVTAEIRDYFQTEPAILMEHNGWSAIAGLDAPLESEPLEFGIRKLSKAIEGKTFGAYTPLVLRNIDYTGLDCWFMPYLNQSKSECTPISDLERAFEENAEMMRRYTRLYDFAAFDVIPGTEFKAVPIRVLKDLHRLRLAYITYLSRRGRHKQALEAWINEMHFQMNMCQSEMTVLEMVQRLEMLERSARLLPFLLSGRNRLAVEFEKQLLETLSPPGRYGWPFEEAIRHEGILWVRRVKDGANRFTTEDGKVLYHPVKLNIFKRKYYDYAQALMRAYEYPTGEGVQMAIAAVQKDYSSSIVRGMEDLSSPAQSIVSNVIMANVSSLAGLLGRVLQREDLLRMLYVFVKAEAQQIPSDEMQDFLNSLPDSLHSNMTGEPYQWDAGKGLIYSRYYDRLLGRDVNNYIRIRAYE